MTTFDAPDREFCLIRRARTNTPLQALVLLNDPTFVEAARNLAESVLAQAKTEDDRIALAFESVLSRRPTAAEHRVIAETLHAAQQRFGQDQAAAQKLLTVGRAPREKLWADSALAAWTTVASLLLNLDEAISKI
jgi:hypothetical protein